MIGRFMKISFALTNQDSTIFRTGEKSEMLNITSRYFSFFSNASPASWVPHITRDFVTCHSCSYYSSMPWANKSLWNWHLRVANSISENFVEFLLKFQYLSIKLRYLILQNNNLPRNLKAPIWNWEIKRRTISL